MSNVDDGSGIGAPYAALKDREIRVFDIQPHRKLDADIRGMLRIVSLDHEVSYDALSYSWGRRKEGRTIVISGHVMPVTDNLHRALRRLRRRRSTRTIWIDAICINQSDIDERTAQVRIMGEVYEKADCVDVWLGEPSRGRRLDWRVFCHPREWTVPSWVPEGSGTTKERLWALWTIFCGRMGAMDSAISGSEPQWHTRAWVAQEFALARQARFCFGAMTIPWQRKRMHELGVVQMVCALGMEAAEECIDSATLFNNLGSGTRKKRLIESIWDARLTAATDPRDKIFSLMGVTSDHDTAFIGVDYTIPCHQLFAKATFSCLRPGNDLGHLALVSLKKSSIDHLPSWAIDFTRAEHVSSYYIAQFKTSRSVHGQAREARANLAASESGGDAQKHLRGLWARQVQCAIDCEAADLTMDGSMTCLSLEAYECDTVVSTMELPSVVTAQNFGLSEFTSDVFAFLSTALLNAHAAPPGIKARRACSLSPDEIQTAFAGAEEMKPRPRHQKPIPAAAYVLSVATRAFSTMMTSRGVRSVRSIEAALRERPDTPWLVWLQYHWQYSLSCSDGARLIATRLGYVGVTPSTVAPGDQIVMGPGEGHPLVLRCEEGYHTFRGLAYVWGVTDPDSHSGDYESLLAARDRFTDRSQLAGYHLC